MRNAVRRAEFADIKEFPDLPGFGPPKHRQNRWRTWNWAQRAANRNLARIGRLHRLSQDSRATRQPLRRLPMRLLVETQVAVSLHPLQILRRRCQPIPPLLKDQHLFHWAPARERVGKHQPRAKERGAKHLPPARAPRRPAAGGVAVHLPPARAPRHPAAEGTARNRLPARASRKNRRDRLPAGETDPIRKGAMHQEGRKELQMPRTGRGANNSRD